jgi:hypothetical protein
MMLRWFASPLDAFDKPRLLRSTADDLAITLCFAAAVAVLGLVAYAYYYVRERAAERRREEFRRRRRERRGGW